MLKTYVFYILRRSYKNFNLGIFNSKIAAEQKGRSVNKDDNFRAGKS